MRRLTFRFGDKASVDADSVVASELLDVVDRDHHGYKLGRAFASQVCEGKDISSGGELLTTLVTDLELIEDSILSRSSIPAFLLGAIMEGTEQIIEKGRQQ